MKIDYRETANKIRQFGGKVNPTYRGNDQEKETLLLRKCEELGIEPVYPGHF
jgi:tRNA U34 2-thiouridine synthase MnmA/TrmU